MVRPIFRRGTRARVGTAAAMLNPSARPCAGAGCCATCRAWGRACWTAAHLGQPRRVIAGLQTPTRKIQQWGNLPYEEHERLAPRSGFVQPCVRVGQSRRGKLSRFAKVNAAGPAAQQNVSHLRARTSVRQTSMPPIPHAVHFAIALAVLSSYARPAPGSYLVGQDLCAQEPPTEATMDAPLSVAFGECSFREREAAKTKVQLREAFSNCQKLKDSGVPCERLKK